MTVHFRPKQLGSFEGALALLGFGGRVLRRELRLSGRCGTPQKAKLVGGVDALPSDFARPSPPAAEEGPRITSPPR